MLEYTPMMNQYLQIKENYKDALLFFRLGDFYELFFEDAIKAVKELDIALTKKSCGKKNGEPLKVDMCGVPFHSADGYISKLVSKGYKVAICEQIENPKDCIGKIVKREVVRIITAGTVIDSNMLEEGKNNYIMCIFENKLGFGISICDVSTGEFLTSEFKLNEPNKVIDEVAKYSPSEIIANDKFSLTYDIENIFGLKIYNCIDFYFLEDNARETLLNHFKIKNLNCFGIEQDSLLISSSGALISHLLETQKNNLAHILNIKKFVSEEFMFLDISSRRNLELTENIREKTKKGSLLWVLDKTKTPMGARLIRKWIEQPLINKAQIEKRLDAVKFLKENPFIREDFKENLTNIKDIERLIGKISYQTANARDLISLKTSFESLPNIKSLLNFSSSELFSEIYEKLDTLEDLYNLIENSILDEPPFSIREGGMIKDGFNNDLDNLRTIKNEGSNWLINLELKEKEKTGIKNLKIKFNKVFGYYIEISNSNLNLVPENYIRKQTLANGERFITEELKKIEEDILNADEKITEIEFNEFNRIKDIIANDISRIQQTANFIAILDVIVSFAEVAEKNNYNKPSILEDEKNTLNISLGRHPVIELLSKEQFIPNNTNLNTEDNLLSIITGPNMAGKSTYMRQVALIVLMAQIGSFVPADIAEISIVDRIFTRVGASDDLATGQSTFMVEMSEVANILNNATNKSLLILDEIGRGTSTFDGLSIAWSVLEYIADKSKIGARTLFATHYHELTTLSDKISGVKNYFVEIKDNGDDIVFLRKIVEGVSNGSYGIHVAKIAGVPTSVIKRANEILEILNINENSTYQMAKDSDYYLNNNDFKYSSDVQRNVLFIDEISSEINNLNLDNISPIEAFQKLIDLKNKFKNLKI